jgi:hypothetical protein
MPDFGDIFKKPPPPKPPNPWDELQIAIAAAAAKAALVQGEIGGKKLQAELDATLNAPDEKFTGEHAARQNLFKKLAGDRLAKIIDFGISKPGGIGTEPSPEQVAAEQAIISDILKREEAAKKRRRDGALPAFVIPVWDADP